MKKIIFILLLLTTYEVGLTQQKYDDGPITGGGNFVVSGTWGRNNISFSFLNGTNDIANDDERNAVRQAFQLWADYANLNFTEVATNGDIRVSWQVGNHGDGNPFDGLNGVLAHAFFPPPAGGTTAFAGDVHFDDAETWTMLQRPVPSGQPIDLVTVAAHEIGHALGLGHSDVACALMNAFYNGSHRYLAQDDIDGIQSIYGNRTVIRSTNLTCSGGTLFINNLPAGATVFWTSANTSIATVANSSNQGIVARVGSANGTVRITGTITLPCGTTVIEFLDILIGAPQFTYEIVPSPISSYTECYKLNKIYSFTIQPTGIDNYYPNGPYQWYSTSSGILPSTTKTASLTFTSPGDYTLTVRPNNACGLGPISVYSETLHASSSCSGGYYLVSPNPVSSNLNIETITTSNDNSSLTAKNNIIGFDRLEIFDKSGNIVLRKSYPRNTKKVNLNVSVLRPDVYVVRILNGNISEEHKIIVQH